jgi:hypothetical protein
VTDIPSVNQETILGRPEQLALGRISCFDTVHFPRKRSLTLHGRRLDREPIFSFGIFLEHVLYKTIRQNTAS